MFQANCYYILSRILDPTFFKMFKNNWESKLDFLGKYKFSNFDEIEQSKKVKQKSFFFLRTNILGDTRKE